MPMPIVVVATGDERYRAEAKASVAWHRQQGFDADLQIWTDDVDAFADCRADVQLLPSVATRCTPAITAWYYKTWVLRHLAESKREPFALFDTYARLLRADAWPHAEDLARRFSIALTLDPRQTLERDLRLGRGLSEEVVRRAKKLPPQFPLWNTGVILVSPDARSRSLLVAFEELSRADLLAGRSFREQITLVEAVYQTAVAPLTLPDSYNVRRPLIEPAIILHTRRYGHLYGLPEVDRPELAGERWRHWIKLKLVQVFRLRSLFE
jgi:hypothetical protein